MRPIPIPTGYHSNRTSRITLPPFKAVRFDQSSPRQKLCVYRESNQVRKTSTVKWVSVKPKMLPVEPGRENVECPVRQCNHV